MDVQQYIKPGTMLNAELIFQARVNLIALKQESSRLVSTAAKQENARLQALLESVAYPDSLFGAIQCNTN